MAVELSAQTAGRAAEGSGVPRNVILEGDARAVLRSLPEASVHLCISSPPYYSLRNYETEPQVWGGRTILQCAACNGILSARTDGLVEGVLRGEYETVLRAIAGANGADTVAVAPDGADMRGLPTDIQGQRQDMQQEMWQSISLQGGSEATAESTEQLGAGQYQLEGRHQMGRRVQDDPRTAGDSGSHTEGLHDGASVRYAAGAGQTTGEVGRGASPKRRQNRQPGGEPGGGDACSAPRPSDVPQLPAHVLRSLRCVYCGSDNLTPVPCQHVWGAEQRSPWANEVPGPRGRRKNTAAGHRKTKTTGPFCQRCGAWKGEFGQEVALDCKHAADEERCGVCYVCHMVDVCREIRRVLRPDGLFFLNLGDTFAGNPSTSAIPREAQGNGTGIFHIPSEAHVQARRQRANRLTDLKHNGFKNKDKMLVPARVAIALQEDGWWMRMDHPWEKANCMPDSAMDRATPNHEYVFMLAKSERYFFDIDAVSEPVALASKKRIAQRTFASQHGGSKDYRQGVNANRSARNAREHFAQSGAETRHPRSVLHFPTESLEAAHFATMPEALVEWCMSCGSSPMACEWCGAPWERVVEREKMIVRNGPKAGGYGSRTTDGISGRMVSPAKVPHLGWRQTCRCIGSIGSGRCIVLDPFSGSGTVPTVAQRLDRDYLGIDLKPEYTQLAIRRVLTAGCAHTSLAPVPEDGPEQMALFG